MSRTVSQFREEIADREAIRDCMYRYARGMDRCDVEMLRSAYWEDAIDDHLAFRGTREELIAWAVPIVRMMDQGQHIIGNMLIRIDGNFADVESYFYGFHRIRGEDKVPRDAVGAGRYLDRFEKRNDEWRIVKRIVMTDWFRQYDDSADWAKGFMGMMIDPGRRHPDDLSYTGYRLPV
jgi:ketosteroid isomerase-like protein